MRASGFIKTILPDDVQGAKHQRFVVQLTNHKTVLVIHNIDISGKIGQLKVGAKISFQGEFIWNNRGGMVHWTHKDPHGKHSDGWIKYQGKIYQ
ncbi:DUF3465 domain-containing protein [Thalassotalea sp. PLHSN55]|uniref:DUF3465 domain-containing protein n=1 Tax=Thalassotalea sp. PLHSN55 TaxID=3435888 RepID=UPI003F8750FB